MKANIGLISNIFQSNASKRIEECIESCEISLKVKRKILSLLERCNKQLFLLRKIDDSSFLSELLLERQHHFIKEINLAKYWSKDIHARWTKSIIIAMCRRERERTKKFYDSR